MKIRWTKNSVRFRVTPSELGAIRRGETVAETLPLAGGAAWRVEIARGPAKTALTFEVDTLRVLFADADCRRLVEPDREGVYFEQEEAPGLRYFIEKDFPCAHPRAAEALETPTETFAPPPGFEERKNS